MSDRSKPWHGIIDGTILGVFVSVTIYAIWDRDWLGATLMGCWVGRCFYMDYGNELKWMAHTVRAYIQRRR